MKLFNSVIKKQRPKAEKGDVITFGKYYFDSDEPRAIEWIVLDSDESKVLVISKYALEAKGYIDNWRSDDITASYKKLIWEFSDLRKWLNEDFYNTSFDNKEKEKIINTDIQTTEIDADKSNRVFILSEQQVEELLSDGSLRCALPTPYAKSKNAAVDCGTDCSPYWILPHIENSAGYAPDIEDEYLSRLSIYPQAVTGKGLVYYHSRNIYHSDFTVRVAMYIDKSCFC